MAFTLKENNEFELAPAGVFPARCYRLIDLGTVAGDWQGRPTHSRKVMVGFELLDDDAKMADGRPFSVSRRFTLSLSEKSALRAFIQQWRGKPFTQDELSNGFDIAGMIGAPCLLTIAHIEKGGRVYANIQGASALPKGYPCPAGVNPPIVFDLDYPSDEILNSLSEGIRETIRKSPEYQKLIESGEVGSV